MNAHAKRLLEAHFKQNGLQALPPAEMEANGAILTLLLQLLGSSGLNITTILSFAARLVPLILVRPINWTAIFALVSDFFKTTPTPSAPQMPELP